MKPSALRAESITELLSKFSPASLYPSLPTETRRCTSKLRVFAINYRILLRQSSTIPPDCLRFLLAVKWAKIPNHPAHQGRQLGALGQLGRSHRIRDFLALPIINPSQARLSKQSSLLVAPIRLEQLSRLLYPYSHCYAALGDGCQAVKLAGNELSVRLCVGIGRA